MRLTAHRIKDIDDPKALSDLIRNVTFVPTRITQQGVHRGEDCYDWDLFTFTKPIGKYRRIKCAKYWQEEMRL